VFAQLLETLRALGRRLRGIATVGGRKGKRRRSASDSRRKASREPPAELVERLEATPSPRRVQTRLADGSQVAVGVIDALWLWDGKRAKALEVRLTLPPALACTPSGARGQNASTTVPDDAVDATTRYPVIVFSHGAWGSKDDYQVLTRDWAAAGFICLQPNHSDADADPARRNGKRQFSDWPNRPADVTFLLDSLRTIEQRVPGLAGRVRRDRVGVGGHSFGASTAQLIGGATVMPGSALAQSFRDPRAAALLLLSPQGRGPLHKDASWVLMTPPMLTITGTRDRGRAGQPYTWRLEPFERCPKGDKHALVIEDGGHDLGGLDRASPHLPLPTAEPVARLVRDLSLDFWQAYLGEPAAALSAWSPGRVERAGVSAEFRCR
jgi:dienelactone hydrolase